MVRQTKHIFLDLPKLSEDLQNYIDTTSQLGGWSSNCVQASCAGELSVVVHHSERDLMQNAGGTGFDDFLLRGFAAP